ncbi:MAG TPA: transporter [Caulobacteraceae bacterium]
MPRPLLPVLAALAVLSPFTALAEDTLRPLCTDRPTKSTSPCTVDAGHFQLESDLFNETVDHTGGVTTTTQLFTSPTLKLGLTRNIDIEANITPYERVSVRDHGVTTTAAGFGDLFLKAKVSLLGDDGGNLGVGLVPYLKVPTAHAGVGNGAVEGGLIAPVQFNLPQSWSVVIDPEVDVLENNDGLGHHANAQSLVSVSKGVTSQVTLSAELWSDVNWDPAGRTTQVSADLGAAWVPKSSPNLQFDGGFNFGLNHVTPGVQGYVGVSRRF